MSSFLPSFFQKQLLKYAVRQLGFIDTDSLDLNSLNIALGQRSTFELKDIGLRLEVLFILLYFIFFFLCRLACQFFIHFTNRDSLLETI